MIHQSVLNHVFSECPGHKHPLNIPSDYDSAVTDHENKHDGLKTDVNFYFTIWQLKYVDEKKLVPLLICSFSLCYLISQ